MSLWYGGNLSTANRLKITLKLKKASHFGGGGLRSKTERAEGVPHALSPASPCSSGALPKGEPLVRESQNSRLCTN